MKITTTITLLLSMGISLFSQDFIFDPASKQYQLKLGNDVLYNLELVTTGGSSHATMSLHSDELEYANFSINNDEGGELLLRNFNTPNDGVVLNDKMLNFVDGTGSSYLISRSSGFQAFDNNGNMTVQIRGDVSGDGRVSTNELEITGGSDLSEHFDITNAKVDIQPGMIVSISGKQGELSITNSKRDKKIVGIISGANGIQTGMLMGQKGSIADGDYPVALTGRTYVLANTENGPIESGDFITSSSIPGYGMKVKNHKKSQGAIIGKAMTELEKGSGYVLVLVNLQ